MRTENREEGMKPHAAMTLQRRVEAFQFRLYVNGKHGSAAKLAELVKRACREELGAGADLQVIDAGAEPGAALEAGVFVLPVLKRIEPGPMRWILGGLKNPQALVEVFQQSKRQMEQRRTEASAHENSGAGGGG